MKFNKNVQVREEKFGTVIFETLKEKVFVTNTTGADIVRLAKEKTSREEIIAELSDLYGIDRTLIARDVDTFLNNLVAQDILKPV